MVFSTKQIPIIDVNGKVLDQIILPEVINPVPRRRCGYSEKGLYYKGAGIIYTGHFVNEIGDGLSLVKEMDLKYEKYNVVYANLYRKFGIFTFNHQPCFSDFEGGCGKKESKIINMQKKFAYSAIEEITNVIQTPIKDHSIYVYKMKDVKGNYRDTIKLIEYILSENFNTAWDKNVWNDIESFGYVRDLADWYVSSEFCHKLGTVYALLSTLSKEDKYTYERVVRNMIGLEQLGEHHIIYVSAKIIKKYANKSIEADVDFSYPTKDLYAYLWKQLFLGKACCHLECDEKWNYVRDEYFDLISKNIDLAMHDYLYHSMMIKNTVIKKDVRVFDTDFRT